jgi:hypothetical protein
MSVEAAARAELARQIAAANAELRQLQAAKRDAERQQELQVRHHGSTGAGGNISQYHASKTAYV